ncbi:MAG: AMP-binding protein [Bacteroidetes bacterium]|nr:AMP-binding protein [Bacteroidota bacterium]
MYKDIVLSDGIQDDYLQSILNFVTEWESYSPVIPISTSGTTGSPKTIKFTKKQVESSAKYTGRFFDFKEGDAVLLNLSPQFVAGKLMIVRALVHKLKLVVAPLNSNPLADIDAFPHPVKLAAFVPHQVEEILSNEHSRKRYNEIANVIIGGASVPKQLEEKIAQQQTKSYATFGMTETLTHFALRPVDGKTEYYTCLPGITVDTDQRGCLIVLPNEILAEPLITNDLVELINDHTFLWKGRFDNVINSGGVKIFPESDEKLIEHLLGETRFYLSSRFHEKFGEEVVLVLESSCAIPAHDAILLKIASVLPKYHAPKSIVYLAEFEETANGKIKRIKF